MADNRFATILLRPWADDPFVQLPRFMANDCVVGVCVDAEDKRRGLELLDSWAVPYRTTLYWADHARTRYHFRSVKEILLGCRGAAKLRYLRGRPVAWAPIDERYRITTQLNDMLCAVAPGRTLLVGDWGNATRIMPAGWERATNTEALEALRKELLKNVS